MNIITNENKQLARCIRYNLAINEAHVRNFQRIIGEYAGHYEAEETCLAILEKVDEKFRTQLEEDDDHIVGHVHGGTIRGTRMSFRLSYWLNPHAYSEYGPNRTLIFYDLPYEGRWSEKMKLLDVEGRDVSADVRRNAIWRAILMIYNNVRCRSCGDFLETVEDICGDCSRTLSDKPCECCLSQRGKVRRFKKKRKITWEHPMCNKRRKLE